jgi:F-type H+-transporting ATPase subunit epsilon
VSALRLRVQVPLETVVDADVAKVVAEATDGWFCLLPHHVDLVTTLVAGVMVYEDLDGDERFVAVDEAVLVKCGPEVLLATPQAVTGPELGQLQTTIEALVRARDEREALTRAAMRKLEATFLRGLLDLEEVRRG